MSGGLAHVLAPFPRERQWLLPALHAAQHEVGWLPHATLAEVAAHLRVPASEVFGVATHYPEFRLAPRGRHHVRVCGGVSCRLLGGADLLDKIARASRVTPGETGADRELTLEAADCFFECSMAPLIELDGKLRGRVTRKDVARLRELLAERREVATYDLPVGASPPGPSHGLDRGGESSARMVGPTSAGETSAQAFLTRLLDDARARVAGRPRTRLIIQAGACGRAVGAEAVLDELRRAARAGTIEAEVVDGACDGACYAAPTVSIVWDGELRILVQRATADLVQRQMSAMRLLEKPEVAGQQRAAVTVKPGQSGSMAMAANPFWKHQERVLLDRCGAIDPGSLDDALLHGAYAALARALDHPPADVIEAVKASGLQGRGGAFFPTALKWEACRKASGEPKYVVLNGEEGEPGIFKDRHLMEGDPHQVLEGVLLAAYASGATRAILYVHGEADLSASRLAQAVSQAQQAGLVGERMLGRDTTCHVELRRGAGGFVLGEETALLESIEGRRSQPRTRPPFPVEAGLWGKPTVINNVETLASIPVIVRAGPRCFAALGTDKAPGTKVFGLSGPLARPGVVEVRNGVTLRYLLQDIGGGIADGRGLKGAVVGGPSGSVVPASLFDVPMEPRGRVSPGTGGIVAVPEGASIVEIVKTLVAFNAHESCGKCTPCREGLPRLLALIDELGTAPAIEARLTGLAETIQLASLCGLGQAAPLALLRGLDTFGEEFRRRA